MVLSTHLIENTAQFPVFTVLKARLPGRDAPQKKHKASFFFKPKL